MKRSLILALFVLMCVGFAQAQTTVTGKVTDSSTGEAIPFASVIEKGTSKGGYTDNNGNYTITVTGSESVLQFSFVGYVSLEQTVGTQTTINASLGLESTRLDEAIVVGYGEQRKKDVTSSISRVGGADLEKLASPSFEQQLAGRAAGVQVVQPSGTIGAAPIFRIRGVNSLSSSTEPLFVVDGVPVTSGDVTISYAASNAMADINPADIESINILKDGAATAIYGSRASNGVVLITTKKGRKGRATLSYSGYAGFATTAKNYDLLNASQFVDIANEMYDNNGIAKSAVNDGTDTKWKDYLYRTAFQHSHTVSASGGTEKSQYYFSAGFTNQDGIIIANSMRRFTAKANASTDATKWLKFGTDINASTTKYNGIVEGSNSLSDVSFSGIRMLPNVAVYNSEHHTGYNIDATDPKALGRGSNLTTIENGMANIRWLLDNNTNISESYRAIANAFVEIKPLEGLSLKSIIGADILLQDDAFKWHPDSGDGYSYNGLMSRYYYPHTRWNWQNIISYNVSLNNVHNIDVTAVQEYNKYSFRYFGASGQGFSDNKFLEDFISGTFTMRGIYGASQANGMASYMGRVNYNYNSKYYIGGSIRRDGLSKLPKKNRWGTFFGASAAWRVSNEAFWSGRLKNIVNDFRIRASYATVGNQGIRGNYPSLGTFSPVKYGSQSGLAWQNVANLDLKWETQKTMDIGFDAQLLNGRFNVEFAYWQKNNSDIVLDAPTDPSIGLPSNKITQNIGQINNNGIEITIGGAIINNKNFSWKADINFSTQNNKVKTLVNGVPINGKYTTIREGESMNSIWGYDFAGVNRTNGNPMWHKADGTVIQYSAEKGNYFQYNSSNQEDLSTRATLNFQDKKIFGSALPKWFGGFNNVFTYSNFDLTMFFRFSGGNKIMNATRQEDLLNTDFANKGTEILNRWQSPQNPGNGEIPKLYKGADDQLFFNGNSDSRFVENGSFLKLSNIMLGYTIPKQLGQKIGITNARVYASVQNVFTITKYKGLDPEITRDLTTTETFTDGFGVERSGKPMQRTFILGLNFSF